MLYVIQVEEDGGQIGSGQMEWRHRAKRVREHGLRSALKTLPHGRDLDRSARLERDSLRIVAHRTGGQTPNLSSPPSGTADARFLIPSGAERKLPGSSPLRSEALGMSTYVVIGCAGAIRHEEQHIEGCEWCDRIDEHLHPLKAADHLLGSEREVLG
jgi:hypothetical protein